MGGGGLAAVYCSIVVPKVLGVGYSKDGGSLELEVRGGGRLCRGGKGGYNGRGVWMGEIRGRDGFDAFSLV